jgi:hypothetical protein
VLLDAPLSQLREQGLAVTKAIEAIWNS